jgi:phosphoglycolate phosphatase
MANGRRWLALREPGRYRVQMTLHPIVVFDLDGTLVDTAPDLVATLNTIFAREGLAPVAYETARNMVGGGARMMIERGLAAEGRTLPALEVDRLFQDFIAHYGDHIADTSGPFQGVETALDELSRSGCRLAVCTNKLQWLSLRLLDLLGLSPRFAAICGPDTFGVSKPNPEILRGTIERAGGDIGRAIMVGDSGTDVATARAANVPVVAVDFGYTEVPAAELAADRIISRFADLPAAVFELLAGGSGELVRNG